MAVRTAIGVCEIRFTRRRRAMTRWILAALLCLAGPARAEPLEVLASPIPLSAERPDETGIGALRYTGGLILTSRDKRFGGWSGMLAAADGTAIRAVSDRGFLMDLHLVWDANGALTGVAGADIVPLRGDDGAPLSSKRDADAESLALGPDGDLLIAYERKHRLESAGDGTAAGRMLAPPPQFPLMPQNGGVEALATLADGRLLALSEGFTTSDGMLGWLGRRAPAGDWNWDWETLTYPYDGRNVPTGATVLPDGDVLVLERRYSPLEGIGARIRRIPAVQMTPGAMLDGPVLADWAEPYSVDNFEGIAAFTRADGAVRVLVVSDDNFSALQRTLLMSFEIAAPSR